ncbi:MAG: inositol monophosphatase family protein [Jatrophihabitans sp.]|nr:MAG: inositol monophosphatase family protein [Jatrophihabitans sp.]
MSADDAVLAASLVRDAGRLAARMRARGLDVARKTSITDVVTDADRAAEKLVGERLAAQRPADGVVGEEGTTVPGGRTWFVDPVDGTYNFLSGLSEWCSALALADGEDLLLGAVYRPATDELWLGGRDLPATCNGTPLPALVPRPLAEISLATYLHPGALRDGGVREPLLRAVAGAATLRMFGSGSVELAAVAAGRLGAWLHVATPDWDWLPGAALVRAAGGVAEVFEAGGRRWHVAGNARAVAEITALVVG